MTAQDQRAAESDAKAVAEKALKDAQWKAASAEVDRLMLAAGWRLAKDNASSQERPFLIGNEGLFNINGICGPIEHSGSGGLTFHHKDPVTLAKYLIEIGERENRKLADLIVAAMAPKPAPPPEPKPEDPPQIIEKIVSDPADKERIRHLEEQLAASQAQAAPPPVLPDPIAALEAVKERLDERPETPESGYPEYGPPEVVTEVEPEAIGSGRGQRLLASEWLRAQMKEGETLADVRSRLLIEYNELLNKNVTASFASDAERIRFRDLTANMTDFSKGA